MSLHGVERAALPLNFGAFSAVIDVRSPDEFAEDHLPAAINLPVLDNEERVRVGTLYNRSPFEARKLGAALISRNAARFLEHDLRGHDKGWTPLVYCWRGGMRSHSLAVILRSIGWRAMVLDGGYKAWRKFVREDLDRLAEHPLRFHILAGLTGSAKTRLLHAIHREGGQILDLEALANHRGSLLGTVGPQPSQKHFESRLHEQLSRLDPDRPVFAEAESNRIGTVHIPATLWKALGAGVVHEVTLPIRERAAYLLEDYEHFPADPRRISGLVDELRRIRGNTLVDQWQLQIESGEWREFVLSILEHHYDLAYRQPGSQGGNYRAPTSTIALPDATPSTLRAAAANLIAASNDRGA
jgi:tRNA 2-selenouridine synthase